MWQIITGNNVDVLRQYPDNTFDSIVTDPPYGIDFLGKAWDATTGALETYQECLRVLKPGGHILAFSAARTYHHLAVTIEQAGFEIRDQIMWIYSSGFPKSQDIGRSIQRRLGVEEHYTLDEWEDKQGYTVNRPGETMGFGDPAKLDGQKDSGLSGKVVKCTDPVAKAWSGWGTQLKPAHEPIVLARKPIKLSIARNCQAWGVGALNIDAARVGERFPSNVIGEILQEDYQKYFYCPKVGRAERHVGFDVVETETNAQLCASIGVEYIPNSTTLPGIGLIKDHGLKHEIQKIRGYASGGNNHPTVKPVELMKYLIKLITPAGGHVLDPFNGSGSTGCAAVELDYDYTGIELDPAYVAIAERRIAAWYESTHATTFTELFTDA